MKINEKIRTIRTHKNLTQEKMAEQLDISTNGYSKIESGKTKMTLERIQEIAQILNMDIFELINTDDDKVVIMANENKADNSSTILSGYYHGLNGNENEKLTLIISHQKELLAQKDAEITALKEIIELLKSQ